jgi:ribosomal protein S18 acetylase RimI-like enzyme
MGEIKYKRLELSDAENIIIEYKKDSLEKFIENKENYLFVGIKENKAIAFLYGYGMLRPDGKSMFYIHSVDVISELQSKGIGTCLMEFTLDYVKKRK